MRLSADPVKLSRMAPDELAEAIIERRALSRAHRDAKGDDRCWLDDPAVWAFTEGAPVDAGPLPSLEEGMQRYRAFYPPRRAEQPDAGTHTQPHDRDLAAMTQAELAKCLTALQIAIRTHAQVKDRPRNLDDDRALYAALPEKTPADFRLPPEPDFLGEAKAPHAGCPSFWRSHQDCGAAKHDLHRWGPCGKETGKKESA